MKSKILAVGIIILFIGVSVVSSADSVNQYNIEDIEPKTYDNYKEIYSIIRGSANGYTVLNRGLIWRDVSLSAFSMGNTLTIKGRSEPYFELFSVYAEFIHAPCFIGWIIPITTNYCSVFGIAIGNIEWS